MYAIVCKGVYEYNTPQKMHDFSMQGWTEISCKGVRITRECRTFYT